MSQLGDVCRVKKCIETQKYHRRGLGAEPPAAEGYGGKAASRWATFRNFLEKKSCFTTIGSHFARIQSHLKVLDY